MQELYSLFIIFLCAGTLLHACSFATIPFCENVNEYHPDLSIFSGRIISEVDNGVQFQIFDVLRGNEIRSHVTIWDDSPFDCNGTFYRNAISLGAIGDSIIVAVPQIDSIENAWELLGDYRAPFVLAYISSLRIENDRVKGLIAGYFGEPEDAVVELAYDAFITKVIESEDCAMLVSTHTPMLPDPLQIYPNPATSRLFIETSARHQELAYHLYTYTGQLAQAGQLHRPSIDLSRLSSGVYILAVQSEHGIFRRERVVILD